MISTPNCWADSDKFLNLEMLLHRFGTYGMKCLFDGRSHWTRHNIYFSNSLFPSSFVYHRLILSTQFVGAMLRSMGQLRRGDVVGIY